jgi:peptide/nickel transport system substrate-binding protein
LSVVTVRGADYEPAAKNLANQWEKLGIKVEFTAADPSSVQQNFVIPRAYDVLIYEFHIGVDPDVFAYWASSQATARGLNFANYKSTLADLSLTNARAQLDSAKRAVRYTDFVKRWLADAPAIALYQPNYYYLTADDVNGLSDDAPVFEKTSRFADVQNFTVEVNKFKTTP